MNLLNKKQIYTYFNNVKKWFKYYHGKMELNNEVIDHKIFYNDKEFDELCDSKFEEIRKDIDAVIYFRYKFNFHPQETERLSLSNNEESNHSLEIERNNDSSIISKDININNISNNNINNNNEITENDLNNENISNLFFNLETRKKIFMIKLNRASDKVDLIETIKINHYKIEEAFYVYDKKENNVRNWYFYIKTKYSVSFPFIKYKKYEYNNLEIARKDKRNHILSFGEKVDII